MSTSYKTQYYPTATTDGEYVVRLEDGTGLSFDFKGIKPTIKAIVYFVRASDGVHERAHEGTTYWKVHDKNGRRARASCNIQLGRLRSYLKRTGQRWEYLEHRKWEEEKAQEKAGVERRKKIRGAALDLLDALKALMGERSEETLAKAADALAKAEG